MTDSLPHPSGNDSRISVAVIGRFMDPAFDEVTLFLYECPQIRMDARYPRISDALQDGLGDSKVFDLVVVLQSTSDEYSAQAASALIGRMLFRRLLCCYGPWCRSDGRTCDIWPVSVRIPLESAVAGLLLEFDSLRRGETPLLPMSAPEEVFALRSHQAEGRALPQQRDVVIVSDEIVLRETAAALFRDYGLEPSQCCRDVLGVVHELKRLKKQSGSRFRPMDVFVDIDPPDETCAELLQVVRVQFADVRLFGLTVFPFVSAPASLNGLIDKTELQIGLSRCFRQ